MLAKLGGRWRTLREWATLHEWLPRLLRIPPPHGEGFRPGLFLVELAGCDRETWEWAGARGGLPFLGSLAERQNYRVNDYYAGCPWSRVAREAELLHGLSAALPGEYFRQHASGAVVDLARRTDASAVSIRLAAGREGLLRHGAAWGSLLLGGAAEHEFHGPLGDREEGWVEWLRNRLGAALDLRRGAAVVYLRHECAPPHRSDGDGLLAWWRRQDRKLARLYDRARLSRRRDYETWFLLTPSPAREDTFPADYARLLQSSLGMAWDVRPEGAKPREAPVGRGLRLLARDGVALLYSDTALTDQDKLKVSRLVLEARGGAGAVLWRQADGTPQWQRDLLANPGPLTPPPGTALADWMPYLVARDGEALLDSPDAAAWVVLRGPPSSWHRQGVALLPRRSRLGSGRGDWLRPSQIYVAARHALGLENLGRPGSPSSRGHESLRVATYNVHRCIGMDGRQSVRRILRVLAEIDADIVALQEVSAIGFNQAEQIAGELGLHSVFCPTLRGAEAYGHGLLSRYPLTVNAVGLLPLTRMASYKEPRGAIWVQVQLGLRTLHVVSTHLALGRADRGAQVDALLGPGWIGGLPHHTPLILCGDFNFTPGGGNYRRISARLRDAQLAHSRGPVVKTFSTVCAVARLDHIFLSPHFDVLGVDSPRTHLTRIASDHFPLVADLRWSQGEP